MQSFVFFPFFCLCYKYVMLLLLIIIIIIIMYTVMFIVKIEDLGSIAYPPPPPLQSIIRVYLHVCIHAIRCPITGHFLSWGKTDRPFHMLFHIISAPFLGNISHLTPHLGTITLDRSTIRALPPYLGRLLKAREENNIPKLQQDLHVGLHVYRSK